MKESILTRTSQTRTDCADELPNHPFQPDFSLGCTIRVANVENRFGSFNGCRP
jgi:hypothetical protein